MKLFKTLPEAREYMDGVLDRLGAIIRSHDCFLDDMTPLEYMYMAVAEAVNPQSEAHHHWTQKLSYSHLMTHIMQMDPCDILAIAVMLHTMKSCKVDRNDIRWDRVMDHKCTYNNNVRIVWARLYRDVVRRAIRIANGTASDDDCSLMNSIESMDIQMVVYIPEEIKYAHSTKIETRPYKVNPFTRVIHGTNRMLKYVKLDDIDIRDTSITDILPLGDISRIVDKGLAGLDWRLTGRKLTSIAYEHSRHNYSEWLPATLHDTPIMDSLCDKESDRKIKIRHYQYESFLVDMALAPTITSWIVGALYLMSFTEIHGMFAEYNNAVLNAEPGSSLDIKQRETWDRCVNLLLTSKSIPDALGKFQYWTPVYNRNDEWICDVNFGIDEFRVMETYPIGYAK